MTRFAVFVGRQRALTCSRRRQQAVRLGQRELPALLREGALERRAAVLPPGTVCNAGAFGNQDGAAARQ